MLNRILSVCTVFCLLAGVFSFAVSASETDGWIMDAVDGSRGQSEVYAPYECVMGSSGAAADGGYGASFVVLPEVSPADDGANETGSNQPAFEPQLLLDISSYQKTIDWNTVRLTPLRNFILRCGFTGYGIAHSKNTDAYFENYYKAIKEFGGNVGVYYYSCACSVEEAQQEAAYVLTLLQGKQFELPVFLDVEDMHSLSEGGVYPISQQTIGTADKKNGTSLLTDIVDTFCKTLTDAGYCCGFYTAKSWAENYLDMDRLSVYPFWLAHWTTPFTTYEGKFDVWQYTDVGKVAGITGDVDLNYLFRDFPTEIKAKGQNGFRALQLVAASARMALRISVGLEENDLLYDYNKDGVVTASDARQILRVSVGLPADDTPDTPDEPVSEGGTFWFYDYVG